MILIIIFFIIIAYSFYKFNKKKFKKTLFFIFLSIALLLSLIKNSLAYLPLIIVISGIFFLLYKLKDKANTSIIKFEDINITEAYEILGLKNNASHQEIKEAYFSLINKLHPDKGGNLFLANQVIKAYKLLTKLK